MQYISAIFYVFFATVSAAKGLVEPDWLHSNRMTDSVCVCVVNRYINSRIQHVNTHPEHTKKPIHTNNRPALLPISENDLSDTNLVQMPGRFNSPAIHTERPEPVLCIHFVGIDIARV